MRLKALCGLLLLHAVCASAGNSLREQEYAEILDDTLRVGEIVRLQAFDRSFLGIYTETLQINNHGTAIVLHDYNGFPDQRGVINALRTTLPEHNWSTLSLQMPLREKGAAESDYYALFPEAKARIEAAIAFLREAKVENIAIVGYGTGAMMGLYSISDNQESVAGIATISLPVPDSTDEQAQTLTWMEKIKVPMLDVYAESDLQAVTQSARKRQLAGKQNPEYRQDKIPGVDHLYRHNDVLLVKRIYSWLSRSLRKQ